MKIFAIRHGQTESGKNGVIAYPWETLNETGRTQAISLREEIAKLNIDYVYCSPFQRAIETCKLACPYIDNVQTDDLLAERDVGIYAGVPFSDLDWDIFWNLNENNSVYKECESMLQVTARVNEFLSKLKSQYKHEDVNILLVTHGGILCALDWLGNGYTINGNIRDGAHDNCRVYTFPLL